MTDLDNKYQVILVYLNDGRVIKATVPAFCVEEDEVRVDNIMLTEPMPIPPGMSFTTIGTTETLEKKEETDG